MPKDTIWHIDPHTQAKHRVLQNYLQAWFPILDKYNGKIVYLDGFCGPGRYSKGELGSPIIALTTALDHRKKITGELVFLFVDERQDRVENLKQEIGRLNLPGHFKIYAEVGEFHSVLGQALDNLEVAGKNIAPTFAFVDPFGFSGLPFNLVPRLLTYPKCEVLITFMVSSINRFLGVTEGEAQTHIVELFGTDEVLGILESKGDRIALLRELYQRQLRTVARFLRFFEMCDKDGRTIYYLFFGSNNELGHVRMKEAMWRVDSEGDFRFSDRTNPHQAMLFHQDHSLRLFGILRSRFPAQKKRVAELKQFVNDETAYIQKHLKESLRSAEQKDLIAVDEKKANGERRRKATFADDVLLTIK